MLKLDLDLFKPEVAERMAGISRRMSEGLPLNDVEGNPLKSSGLSVLDTILNSKEIVQETLSAIISKLKTSYGVSDRNPLKLRILFEPGNRRHDDIKKFMQEGFEVLTHLREAIIAKHPEAKELIEGTIGSATFCKILLYALSGEELVFLDDAQFIPGAEILDDLTKL